MFLLKGRFRFPSFMFLVFFLVFFPINLKSLNLSPDFALGRNDKTEKTNNTEKNRWFEEHVLDFEFDLESESETSKKELPKIYTFYEKKGENSFSKIALSSSNSFLDF